MSPRRRAIAAGAAAATALLIWIAVWANHREEPLPSGTTATHIVVEKSARRLTLYRGDVVLRRYEVSLGRSPRGAKEREGDGRTPEGDYVIDYYKLDSGYHRALHVSYPSAADRARAASAGVNPGGLIMIHGLPNGYGWIGRLHLGSDWTVGCIAVTNEEIEEILAATPVGTAITIRP
jgi:murein L,D-transpeptidase YafK